MSRLDGDLIQSVIEHMNEDHGAAVLVYVQAYAGQIDANSARITAMDCHGMQISYLAADQIFEVLVTFGQPLHNAGEIRTELVRMAKEGRKRLGI